MSSDSETDPFAPYAQPIELANQLSPYAIPHPKEAALLCVANELIMLVPTIEETALSQAHDYTLIALSAIYKYARAHNMNIPMYMQILMAIDGQVEDEVKGILPPGVAVLRQGEEALIGRDTMPQLQLGAKVSPCHVVLVNTENQLSAQDMKSHYGTRLLLTHGDAANSLPPTETINYTLRDTLFRAYSSLCVDGMVNIQGDALRVCGGYSPIPDSPMHCLKLIIERASDYSAITPAEGYEATLVTICPLTDGALFQALPSSEMRAPGITKAHIARQLTNEQAVELLRLALTA